MKQQTINLKYSQARTRALSHYLEKEGKTIEGELLDHIDELYDKQVPEVVREFVASQNPESEQDTAKTGSQTEGKPSRQGARKKQTLTESQVESGPVLTM